ncbi:MAG: cupin domain-containing protein [Burkholderiaceae bacterium]|nr:cupin domain-containing protein [Burkholderiaceae bacterium]
MTENDPAPDAAPPIVDYWHLWRDADGVSHQQRCALHGFEQARIGQAAPQWNDEQPRGESTIVFTVLPAGWVGEWHENPAPQWIVPLSGGWWVEAMDGTRVEMRTGELSLGEDQGCVPDAQGRRGHRSGALGDAPAVLLVVKCHAAAVTHPCHAG